MLRWRWRKILRRHSRGKLMVCFTFLYLNIYTCPLAHIKSCSLLTFSLGGGGLDKIELCPLLSLPLPEYRLLSSDSSPPNLFSGAAYFPASTPLGLLPTLGPIGSVTDVCGRKAAKDRCAKMLVEFLTERMKIQDVWKIMGKEASGDKKVGTDGEKEKGD